MDKGSHNTRGEGYLASISPDATLRLHSTVPPRSEAQKGNPEGGKAKVVGMAGGVGLGSFTFMGYGQVPDPDEPLGGRERGMRNGRSGEDLEGSVPEEEDGEDVWDGLDAVEVAEDDDSDEE